jgi:hypothetical protein
VKIAQNNGDVTAKECRVMVKDLLKGDSEKKKKNGYIGRKALPTT